MWPESQEHFARLVREKIPDYDNLPENTKSVWAIKVIAADFYLFCFRNLRIRDKRGNIIPLVPNQAQKKLIDAVIGDIVANRPVRYIILKARQMGFSTIIEALGYWWTTTHKNITSVIVAHERGASQNLYKMFETYYNYSHEYFQPARRHHTKNGLAFAHENGTGGLNSTIKTMVAEGGVGRSDTVHFLHGSEVALWTDGQGIVSGLQQTVPLLPETFIFLESTAQGIGGYFYDEWQFAKKGESVFTPIFHAWHEHDEYQQRTNKNVEPIDETERELLKIFAEAGYLKETWGGKLLWRRTKLKEFRSNPELFMQEYPSNDAEAFIASGRPVFDVKTLLEMEKEAEAYKYECYFVVDKITSVEVRPATESPLKVWKLPEPGKRYVIGADVAEGLDIGDYSTATIIETSTLETVARYRGHIDPDLFGEELVTLGKWYNNALLGVESNNHGIATLAAIKNRFYSNLYLRERGQDEWFDTPTGKLGWRTDLKTKPLMIDDLAKAIRDRSIRDYDPTFIRECMTYVRDERGRTNAQDGMFDDTVIATAIALQMFRWQDTDHVRIRVYKPRDMVRRKHQKRK